MWKLKNSDLSTLSLSGLMTFKRLLWGKSPEGAERDLCICQWADRRPLSAARWNYCLHMCEQIVWHLYSVKSSDIFPAGREQLMASEETLCLRSHMLHFMIPQKSCYSGYSGGFRMNSHIKRSGVPLILFGHHNQISLNAGLDAKRPSVTFPAKWKL